MSKIIGLNGQELRAKVKKPAAGPQEMDLADNLFKGLGVDKKVTIRLGRRQVKTGKLTFRNPARTFAHIVYVSMVYSDTFKKVDMKDLYADGFKSRAEALKEMKKYYPDMTEDSEVTVIRFRNPEPTDLHDYSKGYFNFGDIVLVRLTDKSGILPCRFKGEFDTPEETIFVVQKEGDLPGVGFAFSVDALKELKIF